MMCDRVRSRLDEYYDGEMPGADLELFGAHLAGCAACSAELEALERESTLFARYDRGFEPSPEFWDGVLARIAEEDGGLAVAPAGRESFFSRLGAWLAPSRLVPLAAACAAVVVAVAIGMTFLRSDGTPPQQAESDPPVASNVEPPVVEPAPGTVANHPEVGSSKVVQTMNRTNPTVGRRAKADAARSPKLEQASALPAPVRLAERQYLEAIAALSKDVEGAKGGLDEKLKKPLDDIDRNIITAKQAVEKNPADTEAVLNMLAAYDQKVEVLQSLARYQVGRNR